MVICKYTILYEGLEFAQILGTLDLGIPRGSKTNSHRFWRDDYTAQIISKCTELGKRMPRRQSISCSLHTTMRPGEKSSLEPLQCYCLQPQLSLISEYLNCSTYLSSCHLERNPIFTFLFLLNV